MKISRRALMIAGGIVGGGLLVGAVSIGGAGVYVSTFDRRSQQRSKLDEGDQLVADWILIQSDGSVRILSPHTEMGQGSQTSLLQIVLDELDADPEKTTLELAPALPEFTHSDVLAGMIEELAGPPAWSQDFLEKLMGRAAYLSNIQFTGGSTAIAYTGWRGFRRASACAREMLCQAGADVLGVPVSEVKAQQGQVVHASSGRALGYGELAEAAALLPMPDEPTYKPRSEYRYIGTSHPRIDVPDKVYGTAVYGMDVRIPGMRYAAVAPPPLANGRVTGLANRAEIEAMPGVEAIVVMDDAVGVVADKPWRAEAAARKVQVQAEPPEGGAFDHEARRAVRWEGLEASLSDAATVGQGAARMSGSDIVECKYNVPFLAHTPMEPMNATVWTEGGTIHVASGVQGMLNGRKAAADALGLALEDVTFHAHTMGGGFGRRNGLVGIGLNYITQACLIQKQVGGAVKLIWSREAGVRMSTYRPADSALMQGKLGPDGRVVAVHSRIWTALPLPQEALPPYDIPDMSVQSASGDSALPAGVWRGIHMTQVGFFLESFIDECAYKAGADPLAYRRSMVSDPRAQRALDKAAEISNWTARPQGKDRAYGISFVHAWNSYIVQVADVSMVDGEPHVNQVWAVLDCGTAVNRGSVEAQVQGGIHYGLSAALYGQITADAEGGIVQSNYHDYRAVRFQDAPRIVVELLDSPDAPVGGVGEISTPGIAPAVANAIAAMGDRRRDLPLVS